MDKDRIIRRMKETEWEINHLNGMLSSWCQGLSYTENMDTWFRRKERIRSLEARYEELEAELKRL